MPKFNRIAGIAIFFQRRSGLYKLAVCLALLIALPVPALAQNLPENSGLDSGDDLHLVYGKSFVLKADEGVARVAVGNPKIADVKPVTSMEVLISAVGLGTTNLLVWKDDGSTDAYNIIVDVDLARVKGEVSGRFSNQDVSLNTFNGVLIVEGKIDSQEKMDDLINLLTAFVPRQYVKNLLRVEGVHQVQLEAKIVEVSRSEVLRMGLAWMSKVDAFGSTLSGGTFASADNVHANLRTGKDSESGALCSELSTAMDITPAFSDAFQVAFSLLENDIAGMLSLLRSQGLAKVLAKPTLVAMSGQSASFQVGGEFAVPAGTGDAASTDFKDYGVSLEFTPVVTDKETIRLEVFTSVSEMDYTNAVLSDTGYIPGITTREASTTLFLKDGQTFAIAGLLSENMNSVVNKVPVLGDLPVLGALFRNKEYLKDETELIILVTPRLAVPMNPGEVPVLAGEDMDYSLDYADFFLLDRLGGEKSLPEAGTALFSGPMGFDY